MTIYAIFVCFHFGCRRVSLPGHPEYSSLKACRNAIGILYTDGPKPKPDARGRYPIEGGGYVACLSRHVAAWGEPQS